MPSKSKAQHNLMEAAAHGASTSVPVSVAKEFVAADKSNKSYKKTAKKATKKSSKK